MLGDLRIILFLFFQKTKTRCSTQIHRSISNPTDENKQQRRDEMVFHPWTIFISSGKKGLRFADKYIHEI